MEANWLGRGTSWCIELAGDHADVHRIKVDEERGLVITTHRDGGLNVRDMDTDEILWGLPRVRLCIISPFFELIRPWQTYVREYAHCEYGNGFLIFDRFDQGKEVWRLASEYHESPAPPDEMQQQVSYTINNYIPTSKGSFKPWAVLATPEFTRAYRFVYPNLLVAGVQKAYVWDVLTCELVQVVSDIQAVVNGHPLGLITYVELSPLHVLICGHEELRFFDRISGALVFRIECSQLGQSTESLEFYSSTGSYTPYLSVVPLTPRSNIVEVNEEQCFTAGRSLTFAFKFSNMLTATFMKYMYRQMGRL